MSVTITSELMTNHVAGRVLPAQRALGVAADKDGHPIVFGLDDDHIFSMTARSGDSPTGWRKVVLGAQLANQHGLGAAPVVQCFDLSQESSGAIWLVVAVADSLSGVSTILLSRAMPNDPSAGEWSSLSAQLVERPLPKRMRVTQLTLGYGDGVSEIPLIVAMVKDGDQMRHFQINPDPADTSWSTSELVMPQDAERCLDAAPGYVAGHGRGVYALCALGPRRVLTFTPLPQTFHGHTVTKPAVELAVPEGLHPQTLAALPLSDGQTELYVGGDGVVRYPLSAQAESNLKGHPIADGAFFRGVQKLTVRSDRKGAQVGVWAENQSDLLVYTAGVPKEAGDYAWQAPSYLDREVTALAAYRHINAADSVDTTVMAVGKSDGNFEMLYQDSISQLWRTEKIHLQDHLVAREISTYTTRIVVRDEDHVPVSDQTVQIQPSFDCAALVNGEYYALKAAAPKPARTSMDGTVVIVLETSSLAAPVFQVTVGDQAPRTADPGAKARDTLRAIKTKEQLAGATRSDGKPLFSEKPDEGSCETAVQLLGKLMEAHDQLPADGSRKAAPTRKRAIPGNEERHEAFGVKLAASGHVVLPHAEATRALASLPNPERMSPGDLLWTIASGFEDAWHFFVNKVEEGWEFVVHLGERVLSFVFEVASQVMAAVNVVLKTLFGFDLNDLVSWLGFVFDWGDILKTHRTLRALSDLGFDYAKRQIETVKDLTRTAFDKVRAQLVDGKLSVDHSHEIFARRARQGEPSSSDHADSPQSGWAADHFKNGAGSASSGSAVLQDLGNALLDVAEREGLVLKNALEQISQDVINDFSTLTWSQVIERIVAIIGEALINSTENIALGFLDAGEILLDAMEKILKAHIEIPVLTWVYEKVICQDDGSKLSLLDLACLMTAIPATIGYKIATQRPLFADPVASEIENAKTLEQAIEVLNRPAPQKRRALLAAADQDQNERTEVEYALIVFQYVSTASRFVAMFAYVAKEASEGKPKQIAAEVKVAADWITFLISTTGTVFRIGAKAKARKKLSGREWVDNALTWSQVVFPLRDTVLAVYWRKEGAEAPDATKLTLAWIESGFGLAMIAGVTVSTVLQAIEGPPSYVKSQMAWTTALVFKAIQNEIGGLYRLTAVVPQVVEDPKVKLIAKAGRGAMLGLRASLSLGRAIIESLHDFSDLDL